MSWKKIGLVCVLFAACLMPWRGAEATPLLCSGFSACQKAGYSHYDYQTKKSNMYWRMYSGINCTNYAAYRLITTNGMPNTRPKEGVGNARDWGTAMASVTDGTPRVGSIAWWGKTKNHVAYVERVVSSTEVIVSESNWGREFDWRRVTKGSDWPDGFIHFKDPQLTNSAAPALSGSKRVGEPLKATAGTWKPTVASTKYQWLLDGTAIAKATSATYQPTPAQVGKKIAVKVTVSQTGYANKSATSTAATVAPGIFVNTAAPSISGMAAVDQPLTATGATWSPAPTATTLQWFADGVAIAGATSPQFTPGPELVGKKLSVASSATAAGYQTATVSSATTSPVAPGTLTNTTQPVINGVREVGGTLTANAGTWSQPGATVTWQWLRGGVPISGATKPSYPLVDADRGQHVSVRVTATKAGYTTATTVVNAGVIVEPPIGAKADPNFNVLPRVGAKVTVQPGLWSAPTPTFTYQWLLDGAPISGATLATYTPTVEQLGHHISARVTASRPEVESVVKTTADHQIQAGTITHKQPKISGKSRLKQRLTATWPVSNPANATITYQWLRDGKTIKSATGRYYVATSADLGKRLSTKVTARSPGYTTTSAVTAKTAFVTSLPKVSVKMTKAWRSAKFQVKVTAPSTKPTGKVRITVAKKSKTVKLKNRKATASLTKLPPGTHTVTIKYLGDKKTAVLTVKKKITIR